MQPSAGLSMITGETGAGKSIMLGAVGLLLGNRADSKTLLHEDKKCVIEGVFEIGSYGLADFFEKAELDYESSCIIRREISPAGKSRSFVNDTPVLLDVLKILGTYLMDVHSQHDTLQLGEGNYQLGLIDAFSGAKSELKTYKVDFKSLQHAQKHYSELNINALELQKEADFNQFQLEELSTLGLKKGELTELESSQEILENAEEIKLKINEILHLFQDEQIGVLNVLAQAQNTMIGLERLAHIFTPLKERFQAAFIELKDIEETLSDEDGKVEIDFEKLDQTRNRLSKIYQLQKKHGLDSIEALIALEKELADKVFAVQNMDETLSKAKKALDLAKSNVSESGKKLSEKRIKSFGDFQKSLEDLLKGLGMENSKIQLEHKLVSPSENGMDGVELLFSANKGSTPQALRKVASGGEFSRLLFAIKYMMADKIALPTLIFDEIDAGISGEVALKMVGMMKDIAKTHQVICITHLPQVAGQGDLHYFVFKDNSADKTVSKIKLLDTEERIQELAKMISGDRPSASALESAKELIRR
jgi:DNA repair protein RecN (Recombination protein N)